MSDNEIELNYLLANAMVKTFKQSAEQLKDTAQEMQKVANLMEDGGLRGRGGVSFVDAIRSRLCPSLADLISKMEELSGDVDAAIEIFRGKDQTSAGYF
jgi:uncharacterized protein YukE